MKMKQILICAAVGSALVACGNPEKSAQAAIDHVQAELAAEKADLNPQKQLDAYNDMIEKIESVGKDYAKTPVGMAMAAGRSVDGVSLADVTARRDAMAARAACYADPTVACLTPFSTRPGGAVGDASAGDVSVVAEKQVCSAGFTAADKALDPIRINQQAYAKELIQLALAAAKCQRPDDVSTAVAQYLKADQAQGDAHTSALLSVLATDALKPAWPLVIDKLEQGLASHSISGNAAASALISLAVKYAQMGNARAALARYATLTDTLHYQADADSISNLVSALILDGETDTALQIAGGAGRQDTTAVTLHHAAVALGARMGLTRDALGAAPDVYGMADIQTYFAPASEPERARDKAAAAALEAAVDKLAAGATRSAQTVGSIGLDTDYGVLALVQQKLGEPAKADALIRKAIDYRTRLLGSIDTGSQYDYNSFATYPALIAMARNQLTDAAQYIKIGHLSSDEYGHLLMLQVGRTQDAEHALAIANIIGQQRDLWHCYADLIPAMAAAGKAAEVQKLINAWTGNPAQKAGFHDLVVDGMVAAGDADEAKKYAESQHLADTPKDKLSLDGRLLASKQIAGDKSRAEPLIREMFAIGQDIDKSGGISHGGGSYMNRYTDQYIAQNAAAAAFRNGYVDLGIELYQTAANKDQRPLLAAFDGKLSRADMTRVLMLAQNNVNGRSLALVVDHAIRQLQGGQD